MAAGPRTARRIASILPLALLLFLAACSTEDRAPTGPSPLVPASVEQQTHAAINAYRASRGLPALAWNDVIAQIARRHSQDMASGAAPFGHDGFDARLAAIALVLPWRSAGENVAQAASVSAAVEGWLDSPGHRENIEGAFDLTGVGAANARGGTVYVTQIFIR